MGTAIVGGTILAAMGFVVRSMVNDRKKGGCHGGCSGCGGGSRRRSRHSAAASGEGGGQQAGRAEGSQSRAHEADCAGG